MSAANLTNVVRFFFVSVLISLFSACGGGGGGYSPPPAPVITPPTTYTISGTIGAASGVPLTAVSGVSVALTGAATKTTTTDATGSYTFTGLANGSYGILPSKASFMFNPTSTAVTISGANSSANNFTISVAVPTFTISGAVSGATGVNIALSGPTTGSVTTGAGGGYSFTVPAGSYTLTPSLTGYSFAPPNTPVTVTSANVTATTFVATAIPVAHTLSGIVSPTLSGVLINVAGPAAASAVTNAGGSYSVNLFDGNYTVTPSLTGYTFSPNAAPVAMAGANATQNFTATANAAVKASVNGSVTGSWIEGALITLSGGGQSGTLASNASGNYSFGNLPSGQTYTFTPSLSGYNFTPASVSVAIPAGSSAVAAVSSVADTSTIASYGISGTVAYAGTKTGTIRVQAYYPGCTSVVNCTPAAGTVIAAKGAYTIRGLPNGTYSVLAQMDALGTGQANANNPNTATATPVTIATANGTANLTLADPTPPAPVAPTFSVAPGSGIGLVAYNPAVDVNGQEIATSYQLAWTGAAVGSANFAAQGTNQNVYIPSGLTNGSYSFTMKACVGGTVACAGGTQSAASAAVPATIGATTGSTTVTGTVAYTGTAAGPLYVVVHNNGGGGTPFVGYVTRVAAPLTSPVNYSVAGVPAGTWYVSAVIDNNNNGVIDAGDFSNTNGNGIPITAAGTGTVTANVTLSSANSTAAIGTDHQFDGVTNSYSVNAFVNDGIKTVSSATLFSGPNIPLPVDMGAGNGNGKFSLYDYIGTLVPLAGDTYQFKVTYSDGTTAIISASVTAVLNSFATALTVTAPTTATPTFSWTAPAAPPVAYLYNLNVYPSAGGAGWYYPSNSNGITATSVVYNADTMAPPLGAAGTAYTWQVKVKDTNSFNSATAVSTFTH